MAKRPNRQQLGQRLRETLQRGDETSQEGIQPGHGLGSLFDTTKSGQIEEVPTIGGQTAGSETGAGRRLFVSDREQQPFEAPYPQLATNTSNPDRPRTVAAGYDEENRVLRVTFRNGQMYDYYNVEPRVWERFANSDSPGKYINSVLNFYHYSPVGE